MNIEQAIQTINQNIAQIGSDAMMNDCAALAVVAAYGCYTRNVNAETAQKLIDAVEAWQQVERI